MHKHKKIKGRVTMNGTLLEQVDSFTYLGVLLGRRMNWGPQIDLLCLKHNQLSGILLKERMLSFTKPVEPALAIYNGKVRASITYGAELWGFERLDLLVQAQNKFLRSLTGLPQSTPLKPLLLDLGCLSVEEVAGFRPLAYWRRLWTTPELAPYSKSFKYIIGADRFHKIPWLRRVKSTLLDMGLGHLWEDPEGSTFPPKNIYKSLYRDMVWAKYYACVDSTSLTGLFLNIKEECRLEPYWDVIPRLGDRKIYHQFRVGTLPLKSFTAKWGDGDSKCVVCSEHDETIPHVILLPHV